jgi:hypothetical protein
MLTGPVPNNLPRGSRPEPAGTAFLRFAHLVILLAGSSNLGYAQAVHDRSRANQVSAPEKSEVSAELVDVVASFLAAGENNDPAARGKYLGPKVFYYGHARTRQQAIKQIAALYRRWPTRKFTLTEAIDLFEIPTHRGVYRVTAVYEYKFDNLDEHLSGKSKLTCVVEHNQQGSRITGVDEKLLSGSTEYQNQ